MGPKPGSTKTEIIEWVRSFGMQKHEATVRDVAIATGGTTLRSTNGIPGAGKNGATVYPDVMKGNYVWEIKNETGPQITKGRKQMNKYTNGTGYIGGYDPKIDPVVSYGNGYIVRKYWGEGLVTYRYYPNDPTKLPVFAEQPQEQSQKAVVYQEHPGYQPSTSTQGITLGAIVLGILYILTLGRSPAPAF